MKLGSLSNGKKPTLLSLFDGSGGFPLAGSLCGITPVFASEVEPYPIAVTTSRFPNMRHLGDVSKINGAEIEPVDIITFGSPCQDLSVAGKRAGLKHEANGDEETTRSGLFMEAVRIIKEMRRKTNGLYPNFAIWENVPGAFSSNRGEDFRIVLEELIKICEPSASVPSPDKGGWPYSDAYVGDGWSLAYRTLDAQYWGVPQRRRRIYLVLDLRGERAHKVLFEREGLRGYFEKGRSPWQGTAGNAENCTGAADSERESNCLTPWDVQSRRIFTADGPWPALYSGEGGGHGYVAYNDASQPICMATQQGGAEIRTDDKAPTITAAAGMSGNNQPVVCYDSAGFKGGNGAKANGIGWQEEVSPTLSAAPSGTNQVPTICIKEQHLFENHSQDSRYRGPLDVCPMLPAQLGTGGNNQPFVVESKVINLNKDDVQSKAILDPKGIAPALYAGECRGGGGECYVLDTETIPIHDQATRFSGKRGDKSDGKGNGLGIGSPGDPMNTLTSGDRHVVCYAETYQKVTGPLMANSHPGSYCGQDAYQDMLVVGKVQEPVVFDKEVYNSGENATGGHYISDGGPAPTMRGTGHPPGVAYSMKSISRSGNPLTEQTNPICASDYKDPDIVAYPPNGIRYIVRRLTPTECARLQGFPDTWGHINPKEDLTDEEYSFWLEVRNTHAAINGKTTKEYTKPQMLTWYNKLHTDSAEYKMWGNGIALPTALYVMQGIADALTLQQKPQKKELQEESDGLNMKDRLNTIQKRENLNEVYRTGEPGPGGAYHDYDIYPAGMSVGFKDEFTEIPMACIEFQKGPRNDPESRHGVLDSDLLEIVRDRLIAFQSGPMATRENACALTHIEEALMWMNRRVEDRIERRVLGTLEK